MITETHAIHVFLSRLIAERTPLSVFLPNINERFGSLLLQLEREHNVLIADELQPAVGHRHLAPGMPLRITTRMDGAEARFTTLVRAIDTHTEIATYLLEIPVELDYRERRQSYRVLAPPKMRVRARLERQDGTIISGQLMDISLGGVGLLFPSNAAIRPWETWICHIDLPESTLDIQISAQSIEAGDPTSREVRIGACFTSSLTQNQQRALGHFSAELQRPLLRARRPTR